MSKSVERIKKLDTQIKYFEERLKDEDYNDACDWYFAANFGDIHNYDREKQGLGYGDYETEMSFGATADIKEILEVFLKNLKKTRSFYIHVLKREQEDLAAFIKQHEE